MKVHDLHILPKFSDGWSYLYAEHCRIEQDSKAIAILEVDGKTCVPCANLALLMLGPGVSISHAAIVVLADHGCLVCWCGEQGVRLYAASTGETRSSAGLLHQIKMWADEHDRARVVRKLYQLRFNEQFDESLSIQQIRGMEGVRVRETYAFFAKETGVNWSGRNYDRNNWKNTDPINKALSTANACLYGICHSAILSAGFSPSIGFIHTGKMLSFVYDIADLYKAQLTIPVAFRAVAEGPENIERRIRHLCRDAFAEQRLLAKIIPDIKTALQIGKEGLQNQNFIFDQDEAAPGDLWDPVTGSVSGGAQYGEEHIL